MQFSVNEINIVCSDAAASLHFYRDILGFSVTSQEEGCWHLLCGTTAFLLLPLATKAATQHEYCTTPTISVDLVAEDLLAAKAHLEAHGVRILAQPAPNANRFFIEDPDGLVFEILSKNRVGT